MYRGRKATGHRRGDAATCDVLCANWLRDPHRSEIPTGSSGESLTGRRLEAPRHDGTTARRARRARRKNCGSRVVQMLRATCCVRRAGSCSNHATRLALDDGWPRTGPPRPPRRHLTRDKCSWCRGRVGLSADGTRHRRSESSETCDVRRDWHYLNFKYRSGTVEPRVWSWRAHVPRLSFVTRSTSIGGMIAGTSFLKCTLSTMRWTET